MLQVALDRALFSPGVIDGRVGPKTRSALREYQAAQRLPVTGSVDAQTATVLHVEPSLATRAYGVTEDDAAQVGPWPKTWLEKARVQRLGYKSLAALVAERGHCSLALLSHLNAGKSLDSIRPGDTLSIPNVSDSPPGVRAASMEINLKAKTIRVLDRTGASVGFFHCSIAKHKEKRPRGRCRVKVVSPDPIYVFDPKMWPEIKGINRKLVIPPGPRNPVGLYWIGLSLPGYGIHGTPEPELIGKTGSHGCFRLANWDAVRLGKIIRPNAAVEFVSAADDATEEASDALAAETAGSTTPERQSPPPPAANPVSAMSNGFEPANAGLWTSRR